jgi:hypothetical protein
MVCGLFYASEGNGYWPEVVQDRKRVWRSGCGEFESWREFSAAPSQLGRLFLFVDALVY